MKVFIVLYLVLFNIYLQSEGMKDFKNLTETYMFTYESFSPSTGPVLGLTRLKVLMKNGKIFSALDLTSGDKFQHIYVLDKFVEIVNGKKRHDLNITYDNNGFPKRIVTIPPKGMVGGYGTVEIKDFTFIQDEHYRMDAKKIRMDEFETHHQKWVGHHIGAYTYTYQDSNEKKLYMEGVEVTIDKGKAVKAIDIRSYRPIVDLESKSFLTIPLLFAIVEKRLEKNRQISIFYDEEYGYPYWIFFGEQDGKQRKIFSRRLRKEL